MRLEESEPLNMAKRLLGGGEFGGRANDDQSTPDPFLTLFLPPSA